MEKLISKLRQEQIRILNTLFFNPKEESFDDYKKLERLENKINELKGRNEN